jgi:hypothetical protein
VSSEHYCGGNFPFTELFRFGNCRGDREPSAAARSIIWRGELCSAWPEPAALNKQFGNHDIKHAVDYVAAQSKHRPAVLPALRRASQQQSC